MLLYVVLLLMPDFTVCVFYNEKMLICTLKDDVKIVRKKQHIMLHFKIFL